jgi:hypothetical protein
MHEYCTYTNLNRNNLALSLSVVSSVVRNREAGLLSCLRCGDLGFAMCFGWCWVHYLPCESDSTENYLLWLYNHMMSPFKMTRRRFNDDMNCLEIFWGRRIFGWWWRCDDVCCAKEKSEDEFLQKFLKSEIFIIIYQVLAILSIKVGRMMMRSNVWDWERWKKDREVWRQDEM